jgi:hypothetical protein
VYQDLVLDSARRKRCQLGSFVRAERLDRLDHAGGSDQDQILHVFPRIVEFFDDMNKRLRLWGYPPLLSATRIYGIEQTDSGSSGKKIIDAVTIDIVMAIGKKVIGAATLSELSREERVALLDWDC